MKPTGPRPDLLFRAFGDLTRLRLLHLLKDGELCVCDLVEALRVPQPRISRHLGYLRRAGLVIARREGLWIHYRLAPPAGELHKSLINCVGCCFQSVPQLAADARRLNRRGRGCCN